MEFLTWLVGSDGQDLNALQMSLRGIIIFISALVMLKIGNKRLLGRTTAFDFLVGIIVGSLLSRAINGKAPLLPSIITGFVLIGVHWLFGLVALKSHLFGKFIKGRTRQIIKEKEINWQEMKRAHISYDDLEEELRTETKSTELKKIDNAFFERNGKISFIKKSSEPKIIRIDIKEGVQTVHLKIE